MKKKEEKEKKNDEDDDDDDDDDDDEDHDDDDDVDDHDLSFYLMLMMMMIIMMMTTMIITHLYCGMHSLQHSNIDGGLTNPFHFQNIFFEIGETNFHSISIDEFGAQNLIKGNLHNGAIFAAEDEFRGAHFQISTLWTQEQHCANVAVLLQATVDMYHRSF